MCFFHAATNECEKPYVPRAFCLLARAAFEGRPRREETSGSNCLKEKNPLELHIIIGTVRRGAPEKWSFRDLLRRSLGNRLSNADKEVSRARVLGGACPLCSLQIPPHGLESHGLALASSGSECSERGVLASPGKCHQCPVETECQGPLRTTAE